MDRQEFERAAMSRAFGGGVASVKWERSPAGRRRGPGGDLSGAMVNYCDLSGLDLSGLDFTQSTFESCRLDRVDLRGTCLRRAVIQRCSAERLAADHANLELALISNSAFPAARFRSALFGLTRIRATSLAHAQFDGATLSSSEFERVDLSHAVFSHARAYGATFVNCELHDAELEMLGVADTVFMCDLSVARNVDRLAHIGPSPVVMQEVVRWSRPGSRKYLRGAGLEPQDVDYLLSRAGSPIQFYDCFLSYSTVDEAFASRLFNDLRGAGVSCWKWTHDARVGEPLLKEINDAIHFRQKLVVVVSRASLASVPVVREIEEAVDQENRRIKLKTEGNWNGSPYVLFPIVLDDSIESWSHHYARILREKTYANARGWESDDAVYQRVRDKVLSDLRSESV